MLLTLTDVQRFFSAKGVSAECPVCASHSRFVMGFNGNEATAALTYSSHPEGPVGYLPMLPGSLAKPLITVECSNCGFVQAFSYVVVFNWATQNPDSSNMPLPMEGADDQS